MRLIAHRGFAAVFPENTVLAVREAARWADAVEVDGRRCGSGEVVVLHDATVDRVTDTSGPVREYSREQLADLRVLDSDQGIPTLTDVFEAVPADVPLNVELKETGLAGEVVEMAADLGREIFLSSFESDCLREVRSAAPEVDRAYLFAEDWQSSLSTADALDCRYVHPSIECCTTEFVASAHERGFEVNAWTVRDRETADRMGRRGVDGVIADSPALVEL
mgnify:CR=1 FL=1